MIQTLLVAVFFSFTLHAQKAGTAASHNAPKFVLTTAPETKPTILKPAKTDVIHGNSEFRVWVLDSLKEGIKFGIWESTPGKWKYTSPQWEYCRILSGKTIITEDGGKSFTVRAGDSFLLKPGVSCTWEVLETTRKEFISYDF